MDLLGGGENLLDAGCGRGGLLDIIKERYPLLDCTGVDMIEESDIKKQTTKVMENLKAILESQNITFSHVIKATCFLSDMGNFAAFNEVYATYFTDNPPARSAVAVRTLPKDALVEVEVIAQCE